MGKKDGKPCKNCGTSDWLKYGACRLCQSEARKRYQQKLKLKYKDNPKDEWCKKCGDNEWDDYGKCRVCKRKSSKDRREKQKAKYKKKPKDEICIKCGINDWNLRGECRECSRGLARKSAKKKRDFYKLFPKNEICKICGTNSWYINGNCRQCSLDYIQIKKGKYTINPKDQICDNCGFNDWGLTGECSECKRRWNAMYGNNNRIEMLLRNGGEHTIEEWETLYHLFNGYCLHPDCLVEKYKYEQHGENSIHRDHVISVSNGGTSNINNFQPLCPHHNLSKGRKNMDYRPYAIQYLNLFEKIINENLTYLFPDEYFI